MSNRTLLCGGRQGRGDPLAHAPRHQRPSMLANPYFWHSAAVSLAVWAVLAWIFWGAH